MTLAAQLPAAAPQLESARTVPITGEVVYMYAFDIAYEMKRQPVRELLGQPVAQLWWMPPNTARDNCSSIARKWSGFRRWSASARAARIRLERTIKLLPSEPSASPSASRSQLIGSTSWSPSTIYDSRWHFSL